MIAREQPTTPESLENALDWIRDEHGRQLALLNSFDSVLERESYDRIADDAERLVTYLTQDAIFHAQDEEEDLVPLMRLRCDAGDKIDAILSHLTWEHNVDRFLTLDTVLDLRTLVAASRRHRRHDLGARLRTFIAAQRRHITWENNVVLPLARKRLRREDFVNMGRNMIARRNRARVSSDTFGRATPRVAIREWTSKAKQFFSTS